MTRATPRSDMAAAHPHARIHTYTHTHTTYLHTDPFSHMHTLNSQDFQGWRMFFEPSKVRKEEKAARKKEKREAKKKAKAAKRRARNAGKTKEEQMGKLMRTMLKIFSEKVRLCFALGYLTKLANWSSLSHGIPITRRSHSCQPLIHPVTFSPHSTSPKSLTCSSCLSSSPSSLQLALSGEERGVRFL
jgi:hypothetical protein